FPISLFRDQTPSAPLDEVFIPVQLLPGRLASDNPVVEEERVHHRERSKQGLVSEEMQPALLDPEFSNPKTEWQKKLKKDNRISIAELWERLTLEKPAAVIQGFPGMGKSTLMARIVLHVARRGLDLPDPNMEKCLIDSSTSSPVPILLPLKDYEIELTKADVN